MWRAGITKPDGTIESDNFDTLENAELWVLKHAEKGIKKSIIINKDNIKDRIITNWEEQIKD